MSVTTIMSSTLQSSSSVSRSVTAQSGQAPAKKGADSAAESGASKTANPATANNNSIADSMESLLDRLTGKARPESAGDESGRSAGNSQAPAVSGNEDPRVAQARIARKFMETALQQARDGTGPIGKAITGLKDNLSSMLKGLGMGDDDLKKTMIDFGDMVQDRLKTKDFTDLAVQMSASQSSWTIDTAGIDLTITDGDRKLTVSFAKSTLDFNKVEVGASAGPNGSGASFGITHATGKATGMIVKSEGFSEDEIASIVSNLSSKAEAGGVSGLTDSGRIQTTTNSGGALQLSLNLSELLPLPDAAPSARAETGANLSLTA